MSQPICAPATPLFPGAVAVVRVSGQDLPRLLRPFVALPPPRRASLRFLVWEGYWE